MIAPPYPGRDAATAEVERADNFAIPPYAWYAPGVKTSMALQDFFFCYQCGIWV